MKRKSKLSLKAAFGEVPPCPWCMSDEVSRNQPLVGETVSALSCDNCDAVIPHSADWYQNRESIWTVPRFEDEDDDDEEDEQVGLQAFM